MAVFAKYAGPRLIDQICAVENLTSAWRRVRSNIQVARRDKSAGPDAVTIRDFEADWVRQMQQLAAELADGTYRPLPPKRVNIPKRSGGERAIAILAVRDRVAQRAVQQVIEPLFEPFLLDCAYGCRPYVGVPDALARVERYAQQGLTWVVDADIQGYFDHIDHRILLGLLRQRIDEPAVLALIARWLDAGSLQEEAPLHPPTTVLQQGWHRLTGALQAPEPPPTGDYAEPPTPGIEQRIFAAAALARPVMQGAQTIWPYVRKVGGTRVAVIAAVATGSLAATELMLRRVAERKGAMQGGALSPLLANIYLHPFDLALTSRGLRLVRFMDDFVVMCATEADALSALDMARRQLAELRLVLHPDKTQIVAYSSGLEFLGESLATPQRGHRLAEGAQSFRDAEAALRSVGTRVRQSFRRKGN